MATTKSGVLAHTIVAERVRQATASGRHWHLTGRLPATAIDVPRAAAGSTPRAGPCGRHGQSTGLRVGVGGELRRAASDAGALQAARARHGVSRCVTVWLGLRVTEAERPPHPSQPRVRATTLSTDPSPPEATIGLLKAPTLTSALDPDMQWDTPDRSDMRSPLRTQWRAHTANPERRVAEQTSCSERFGEPLCMTSLPV
jgi:hypothetical protein